MASIDPMLPVIVVISLVTILISTLLRNLKQPLIVAYIFVGIIIGPFGLQLFNDTNLIERLGSIGVLLLLFFIGMEVSIRKLVENWKVAVFGTFFQVFFSLLLTYGLSFIFDWDFRTLIFLGFAISLSSTAVTLKLLQEYKEINSKTGQNVLSILLVQDVIIVPMLLVVSILGGESLSVKEISLQAVGSVLLIAFLVYIFRKGEIQFPFAEVLKKDKELQLFWSLILCFGFALITGLFGLSTALGAFVAGILLSTAKETQWVTRNLNSFYILLVALFFISIGMLLNLNFIYENFLEIILLVAGIFITNSFINSMILRSLGSNWKQSLYGGALLAEIGEFSFILAGVAIGVSIIDSYGYNLIISIIALTLLISPFWVYMFRKLIIRTS